jgi:hypothetical protein
LAHATLQIATAFPFGVPSFMTEVTQRSIQALDSGVSPPRTL